MVKTGSNAVIGSWKIIAAERPRTCVSVVLVGLEDVDAVERQGVGGDLRRGRQEPHQREAGDRFAGAGLADDADAFAFVDVKADAAHRFDDTAMLGKARP